MLDTTADPSTSNVGLNVQGMVHDPWGHVLPNPLKQHAYQQVPQTPPQQPPFPLYTGGPPPVYGLTGTLIAHQYYQPQPVNRQLPFLATLDLPDLSWFTNDPIFHAPHWPPIPRKLPYDILKFNGKLEEDPKSHVMTFHCWCCSNSLVDDSMRLCLCQRTLTGMATKW